MNFLTLFEAASFLPDRLEYPNSWIGHIPFASWLIRTVRPSIFVELGTHSGNSYFAFCQAVKESKLPTRCFAVDTWKGDEHAGYYGEEIYQELNRYHQNHYSRFSSLIRSSFDEAVPYFKDASIELLHVDGLHTYEAVKHDFETWLPKLAPHAVVMFHDINVHEQNFGVWRFWQELCREFPLNFDFNHEYGLGILQLSEKQPGPDLEWLKSDFPQRHFLREYFFNLGQRLHELYQNQETEKTILQLTQDRDKGALELQTVQAQLNHQKEQTGTLQTQLAEQIQRAEALQVHLGEQAQKLELLEVHLAEEMQRAEALRAQLGSKGRALATLQTKITERDKSVENLSLQITKAEQDMAGLKDYLNQRELILQDLNSKLLEIYSSTAWKIILWMWKVRVWLAPSNSWREKFGRFLFGVFKRKHEIDQSQKETEKPTANNLVHTINGLSETNQNPQTPINYDEFGHPWRKEQLERFLSLMHMNFSSHDHISHFIFLPLLSTGGAELVALNFIKAIVQTNPDSSILLSVTDLNIVDHSFDFPSNVIFLNLDDFLSTKDSWPKQLFVYDLIKTFKPLVVHNINSSVMWHLIIDKGKEIREISKIYANIFCFQFNSDGSKTGYAEYFLRKAIPYLDGLISDNERFIKDAIAEYKLQEVSNKLHTIYTPSRTISADDLQTVECRLDKYTATITANKRLKCIWAGRLDAQKKWDLFLSIVKECNFCDFDMYGKSVMDKEVIIPDFPNLKYRGTFTSSRNVFLENYYDVFIFTSQWEGLPTILLDAGIYGVPIIAPSVGGVGELVSNTTGYVLREKASAEDYLATLTSILNDPESAACRAKKMIETILNKHDWSHFLKDVNDLGEYLGNQRIKNDG